MKFKKLLAFFLIRTKLNFLYIINERAAGKAMFRVFSTPVPAAISHKSTIYDSGEPLEFTVNNTCIRGYRLQHSRKRKALILHGFSSTCKNFHRYVSGLVAKNYEVLAFDAPAHGMSEGRTANALDYSRMIEEAHRLYGPFDAYISHSFGGLSVSLALEHIPHSPSTKLVLIAPATETTSAIDDAFIILGLKNIGLKNALKQEIYTISGRPAEWFSVRRAIRNIQADTLWIHDKEDGTTPFKDAEMVMLENIPNVKFIVTEGLGHRKIYRDEDIKNTVIDFVTGQNAPVKKQEKI